MDRKRILPLFSFLWRTRRAGLNFTFPFCIPRRYRRERRARYLFKVAGFRADSADNQRSISCGDTDSADRSPSHSVSFAILISSSPKLRLWAREYSMVSFASSAKPTFRARTRSGSFLPSTFFACLFLGSCHSPEMS